MNPFRIPVIGKLVLGGAGSALLGVSLLGAQATNAFAATPSPTATPAAPAAPAAKADRSDRRIVARAVFTAEAAVLGMKPEDLRAALKSGKTVEQLAAAKGLNKEQFADRLATAVKPALDKLVDAHTITRAQADRVLARIHAGHIPFWNGVHHKKAAA
jgi:hypothetical protein